MPDLLEEAKRLSERVEAICAELNEADWSTNVDRLYDELTNLAPALARSSADLVERLEHAERGFRLACRDVATFVRYADEYPEDISGPLRDDFLPILRKVEALVAHHQEGSADD